MRQTKTLNNVVIQESERMNERNEMIAQAYQGAT